MQRGSRKERRPPRGLGTHLPYLEVPLVWCIILNASGLPKSPLFLTSHLLVRYVLPRSPESNERQGIPSPVQAPEGRRQRYSAAHDRARGPGTLLSTGYPETSARIADTDFFVSLVRLADCQGPRIVASVRVRVRVRVRVCICVCVWRLPLRLVRLLEPASRKPPYVTSR